MTEFENKVALVTGAGSGMGRAPALLLARRGAAVTVVGRREQKLADVVAEITAAGGRALAGPHTASVRGWGPPSYVVVQVGRPPGLRSGA